MGSVYSWIDRVWQWVAERVFVRFEFDLPLERLRELPSQQIIFTLTHVGIIEFLILSSWCRKQGMPAISVANRRRILFLAKPTYFFQILLRRRTYAELFVSAEPGPRLLFCPAHERKRPFEPVPVEQLLGELYKAEQPFTFFPVYVLWRKHMRGGSRKASEFLFGLESDPNLLGKLWFLGRARKDSLVKGLDSFPMLSAVEGTNVLDESDSMRLARHTRRKILVQTHQEMRVILGPRYASPHSVKETILRDPEIQTLIGEVSVKENTDRKKVMSRAYGYLTEIVSHYRYRTIEIFYLFLRWLFTKVFDGVSIEETQLLEVRDQMKARPVVFVCCHRSHLDYLVIPYVLFERGMVTPHIVAGINLAFWPFGPIARSAGAFFIRRSFRGDLLYAACLRKYVEYLLKHRYNIKFFIEGTRSRSGKMLPPAYGILKMVMEAQKSGEVDDIALVPVSLTYDEVPEESSYSRELAGGQKINESARQLLKSRDIVKRNFGKVYVRVGGIVSAKEVNQTSGSGDETLKLQKTAFQLCKNINDATPITAKSILSSVFLGHTETSLSLEEILQHCTQMAEYVLHGGYELSAPDLPAFRRSLEQTVRRMTKGGVLHLMESVVPRRYGCDRRRRTLLSFYKNSAIHCLITPSIALTTVFEVAIASSPDDKVEALHERWLTACFEMRNWLKFDFFFNPKHEFQREVESSLGYFFGPDVKSATVLEAVGKRSLERLPKIDDILIYCRLVEDLMESYLTVARFGLEHPGSRWDRKALLQKILKYGEGLLAKRDIGLPESLSIQNYSNALSLLENLKTIRPEWEGEKRVVVLDESGAGFEQLKEACGKYLLLMREQIPAYLKPHRSPTFPELHFSH